MTARNATAAVLGLTLVQLVVATAFAADLPQFEGKGFGARLITYPLLMLAVPAGWWWASRRRQATVAPPWAAFCLIMLPFLIDVSGNTLDLYDAVVWWDDANHLVNWFLLSAGIGLLLRRAADLPSWALGWLVAGIGALLAVAWEAAEWYIFIRHGTELDTAYTDTLGDLVLGCIGGAVAGGVLARTASPDRLSAAG